MADDNTNPNAQLLTATCATTGIPISMRLLSPVVSEDAANRFTNSARQLRERFAIEGERRATLAKTFGLDGTRVDTHWPLGESPRV